MLWDAAGCDASYDTTAGGPPACMSVAVDSAWDTPEPVARRRSDPVAVVDRRSLADVVVEHQGWGKDAHRLGQMQLAKDRQRQAVRSVPRTIRLHVVQRSGRV